MIGRLNHVAIAVPDLEAASAQYATALGAKVGAPQDEPDHGVTVVFIELPNTKSSCSILWAKTARSTAFWKRTRQAAFTMFAMKSMTSSRRAIISSRPARAFWARGSQRSAHMASLCSFCTPKTSTAVLSSLNKSDSLLAANALF